GAAGGGAADREGEGGAEGVERVDSLLVFKNSTMADLTKSAISACSTPSQSYHTFPIGNQSIVANTIIIAHIAFE
uniref:hypothetical protein n=1 Tax=Chromobacterium subtsugae TaxID=251747 RepID=UPI001C11072C